MRIPIWPLLTLLAVLGVTTSTPESARAQDYPHTLQSLKKLSLCELNALFENAPPGEIPTGYGRGQVLLMTDARHPRLRACLSSSVWKGKTFDCNGDFINQWPGFKALRGSSRVGESWHDGKPCLVLDYPSNTPIFGNTRDELREIAPGLFLARLYETCPCPHFRGYFALQVCGGCR